MSKPFNVNLWGSDPALENDDCWTGEEFDTLAEAQAYFADPFKDADARFVRYHRHCTEYFELDGPGVYLVRRNPDFRPDNGKQDDWAQESRMLAGMAFGIVGLNDWGGASEYDDSAAFRNPPREWVD